MRQHSGTARRFLISAEIYCGFCLCRKEMEVTWNSRGEQYRAEAILMEDKLRNTEQAMMKVIMKY